jgi:ammonia channel protein AmtB
MHINAGDTAWMLTSTALVFFMMPGLAAARCQRQP